jgi:hypothetical protein
MLPVAVGLEPAPGLVRWMDITAEDLRDPFFAQTVMRLKNLRRPTGESDIASLIDHSRAYPPTRPRGLIFHVSRCGSTIISNALRVCDDVIALSEAQPFTHLLTPKTPVKPDYQRLLLRSLARVFSVDENGLKRRLILKLNSWNTTSIRTARRIWPDTPFVLSIRNPVEIMVSNLTESPGWKNVPDGMGSEEYFARVLGRYFKSALEALDGNIVVIDYASLDSSTMRRVAAFMGLRMPAGAEILDKVMARHSHDSTGRRIFRDDREVKQRNASTKIRETAEEFAHKPYIELKQAARRI